MPDALIAFFWGLVSGSALLLGAAIGYFVRLPVRVIAGVMAFGAGVLLSAIAFELMDEAFQSAGIVPASIGFVAGAVIYIAANRLLARWGAHKRKSSSDQPSEADTGGSGAALAVGALLDGIPESIVIGLGILGGGGVSVAMVAAVFISNVPEGLSSAAGMRKAGRSMVHVIGLWGSIAVVCGLASLAGYAVFGAFSPFVIAATTTVAAGAMLAMIADTMIPEAYQVRYDITGLYVVAGFLVSFALTKLT
jgi:ZIP family zinc transporter